MPSEPPWRQSIVIFDASRQTVGKRCNFTSRSCVRPRQSLGKVARVPPKCATLPRVQSLRPRPIHCNFGCVTPNGRKMMQLYLAFVRSTTPIPGKGCSCPPKCATLPRGPVARPRQSIVIFVASRQTVGKRCNFTLRSCVRPRQSLGKVARVRQNVQLYLAVSRSTTPIHCNFRYVMPNGPKKMQLYLAFVRLTTRIPGKGLRVMATRERALDHANPW